jgi:hypothetical protein
VAPELPICNDQRSPAPHDWGIEEWTTPRTVKSFVRNARSRLMVVPSPARPPSTSVGTAGSHTFDSFSEKSLLAGWRPATWKGPTRYDIRAMEALAIFRAVTPVISPRNMSTDQSTNS